MKKSTIQVIAIVLLCLAMACAGCSTGRDGWGCKGKGKIMTRVE